MVQETRPVTESRRDQMFPTLEPEEIDRLRRSTQPGIEDYDPPEGWGWCYIDKVMFDLSNRNTPHNGPIPRYD